MKCRESTPIVKTVSSRGSRITVAATCLLATGQSSLKWHEPYSGLFTELGKLPVNASLSVTFLLWSGERQRETKGVPKLQVAADEAVVVMNLL